MKKVISVLCVAGILFANCTLISANADYIPISAGASSDTEYPYTMFAASDAEGAITINSNNFSLNGNIATNGTIVSSGNMNINGSKTENVNEAMVYILDKLDTLYFSGDNVDIYADDYNFEDLNINLDNPMDVYGSVELTGNVSLSSGIKAFEDIDINYTSVAVVTGEMTYQYPIVEDFDMKYFKVSLTTNHGVVVESVPFVVIKCDDGYTSESNGVNSDSDSLTDWEEVNIKLLNKHDDGSFELPTFFEVVSVEDYLYSFELWKGTAYELSLINQLFNLRILPVLSNPNSKDSDYDGIFDDQELRPVDSNTNEYYSNPFSNDSDEDGIKDFDDPQPLVWQKQKEINWNNTWATIDTEDYMLRRNLTEMIFMGVHKVMDSPFHHTSIIIFATPESKFYKGSAYDELVKTNPVSNWGEMIYVTFGAGQLIDPFLGALTAKYNRKKDKDLTNKVEMINLTISSTVNECIPDLIKNHNYFVKLKFEERPTYHLFPGPTEEKRNSNSYTAGLLIASNINDLGGPHYNSPGYKIPLELNYFGWGEEE